MAGVIRDVKDDIFDADLKASMRATAPVTHVRRLGPELSRMSYPHLRCLSTSPWGTHGTKYIRTWRWHYTAQTALASAMSYLHVQNPRVGLTAVVSTIGTAVLLTLLAVQTVTRTMSSRHGNVISPWQRKKSLTTASSTTSTTSLPYQL